MDEPKVTSGTMKAHDNLRFPRRLELKTTDRVRKWADATLVNRHSDGTFHHASIKFSKLSRRSKNEVWPEESETYSLDEGELDALYEYLCGLQKLKEVPGDADYVLISGDQGVKQLDSASGRAVIGLLLDAVQNGRLEAMLRLANLDSTTLENIGAAVRHTRYRQELHDFEKLIEANANESDLQGWIKRNYWVFGTEYVSTPQTRKISLHCEIDFVLASVDGFCDIIELKRTKPEVLVYDKSHDCYRHSAEVAEVLGQVVNYLQKAEDYRLQIQDEDRISLLKPRGRIVIGRSNDWNEHQKKALRCLNASLNQIDIMTYDQLFKRGKFSLKHILTS